MIELVLSEDDLAALKAELLDGGTEKCAVLFASQAVRADGTLRLLVRELRFPDLTDYARKGLLEAELKPEFVARVTKRARIESWGLIFVHSHPGTQPPRFSTIDDEGEKHLALFLARRHSSVTHGAIVISHGGVSARRIGADEPMRVIAIGIDREVIFDPTTPELPSSEDFDRQIRAFGKEGQEALARLRFAIVGLGGTGSIIAQLLVHLGVRDFILIDPDTLDRTNLNRVANATAQDLGSAKVEIADRYIRSIAKDAKVQPIQGDVMRAITARELVNADLIFGCTDSHGSRAVLQQISYQYLIPCIDMGVTITVTDRQITHIFGRVQLLAPGLACLTCDGLLDPNEVRRDMMTEFERQADPYLRGVREPAPAVMSLNGTVASLAITMMLSVVAGIPGKARHILYNALQSTMRSVRAKPRQGCYICSRDGSYARADSWPLFAREI